MIHFEFPLGFKRLNHFFSQTSKILVVRTTPPALISLIVCCLLLKKKKQQQIKTYCYIDDANKDKKRENCSRSKKNKPGKTNEVLLAVARSSSNLLTLLIKQNHFLLTI